jgi:hypothetical protein
MNKVKLVLTAIAVVSLLVGIPTAAWSERGTPAPDPGKTSGQAGDTVVERSAEQERATPATDSGKTREQAGDTVVERSAEQERAEMKLECYFIPNPMPWLEQKTSNDDGYPINFENTGMVTIPVRTRIKWSFYCGDERSPVQSGRYQLTKDVKSKGLFNVRVPKTANLKGCKCVVEFE